MADISKITLPDNSSYDIKDATARSKLNVLTNNMATCATGRATAAKVATLANFSLNVGATIAVKFTDTAGTADPSSGNLTLNVNNTGAKTIGYSRNGSKAALNYTKAAYFYNNSTHVFTYDGTYWLCMDWNADNDTNTKVTSVANHYTPAKSTTKSASGGTLTDITNSTSGTQVVTGVEMDAKGHVTGVTSLALKSTDTKVTIDSALSSTSTNPVQNKAVYTALAGKAASSHTHSDYASKSLYGDTTINIGRKADSTVGVCSTAEGFDTTASAECAHAEGQKTTASGLFSHAEGYNTTATAVGCHAEGVSTIATTHASHAGGDSSLADGAFSFAHGEHVKVLHNAEVGFGRYNKTVFGDTLFSIGDGTADDARHNAFEITTDGGKLHDNDIATINDLPNPNLLINPDFRINQRGKTEYTGQNNYTVDRWKQYPSTSVVTVVKKGIKLSSSNSGNYADLRQMFENQLSDGETYTITICIDNVEYKVTCNNVNGEFQNFSVGVNSCIRLYLNVGALYIRLMAGFDSVVINYVKLEKGTVATPFVPPDPALELVKCQRYYREIVGQFIPMIITSDITTAYITIDNMRIPTNDDGSLLLPTAYFKNTKFNINSGVRVTNNSGSVISGFVFSCITADKGRLIEVKATKASHGLNRDTHVFVIDTNNPVCIDAEI